MKQKLIVINEKPLELTQFEEAYVFNNEKDVEYYFKKRGFPVKKISIRNRLLVIKESEIHFINFTIMWAGCL